MQTLQTNRFICGEEDELSYADMCAIVEKDKELKSKLDQLNTYLETPGLPVEKKLDAVISTFGKLDDKPGVPLDEESRNLIGSEESSLLRIPDGITLEGKQAMRERCEKRAAIVSEKYLNGKPLRVIEVKNDIDGTSYFCTVGIDAEAMNAIGRKEYAEVLLKQKELERAAAQAERAAGQEQGTSTGMVSPEKLSKVVSEMRSSTTGDEPAAKVEVQNVDKVQVPTPMPKPPSVGGGSPRLG